MKIIKTCIAGLLALYILSAFLLFYGYSGIHITNSSGATDYKWTSHQLKTTMDEGFAWMRFDVYGFNNPDGIYSDSIDVLLLGSSHLEGVHVAKKHSIAAQLRNRIADFSVYNIGISGHTLYRCAQNLSAAVKEYNPQEYVIIETSIAVPDNNSMLEVLNGELKDIPSYDSGVLYYLQKYCPAIKTLYKNIQDWKSSENRSVALATDDAEPEKESLEQVDRIILSQFLAKMKEDCGYCQLIILYHPQISTDKNGIGSNSREDTALFSAACAENDIIFVDMTKDFIALYNEQHRLPYGFVNTAVGKGHLNRYGCEAIGERLALVIKGDQ